MKSILQEAPVKGSEGYYYCTSNGDIYSYDRYVRSKCYGVENKRLVKSQKISAVDHGNGYKYVSLCKNGTRRNLYVHRIIAEAFLGDVGTNVINHKDFNRANNNLSNLEICSQRENVIHARDRMSKPRNKLMPKNKTGEKYIGIRYGKYRVNIIIHGKTVIDKLYKTLDEAIAARNEVMSNEEYFAR